jgi:hypothetical protein
VSDLRIEIGYRYEPMSDERRSAAQEFASELRSCGLDVELEIVGYKPGRRSLSPIDWTSIFIGTTVATTVIGNVTTDLYNRAKRMLVERKRSKEPGLIPGRPLGFVIYGPRGEELRRWTTADDDASEADGGASAVNTSE